VVFATFIGYITKEKLYNFMRENYKTDDTENIENIEQIGTEMTLSVYSYDEEGKYIVTDRGIYTYTVEDLNICDKTVIAQVIDNEVISINSIEDNAKYENVIIIDSDGELIKVCLQDVEREFIVKGLNEKLEGVMADILIENGEMMELHLKRESISGKVQSVDENSNEMEIEGFGKVSLSQRLRVYNAYSNYEESTLKDVVVGDIGLEFIVADKQICGIMIVEKPISYNIRVLLKTSGYTDIFHDKLSVTSNGDYRVIYYEYDNEGNLKEMVQEHSAGDVVEITKDNSYIKNSRITIVSSDENEKIVVNSISRNGNSPSYRGNIELSLYKDSGKLVVINELSLEEYLYSVVPSEMPSSYGVEALKVQAVCARSYAVSHMNNGKLSKYGAQVDDSTDYQVYNSTPETENSISAVNATYGQVLKNGDDIANTYFYATSCGSTTGAEIWGGTSLPYIKGKILTKKETDIDLTDNQQFSEFIKNDYETYDSGNSWYRWSINMTSKQLTNILDNNLNKTYNTNPDNVLTLVDNEYKSQNVNSIGSVTDMYINKRGEGGIIEELIIRGTNGTVKIIKQSAIRNLLNPNGISIVKNDGTSVDTFTSLPSAFFTVDKENGEFKFYGGGYGHGAGMSQTAVKNMVDDGMNYEEILEFFYYECRVEKM
jgi:stage II sporulation protein D